MTHAILREVLGNCQAARETLKYPGWSGNSKVHMGRTGFFCALAISFAAIAPARAAGDLHDLYTALQSKGHEVTIPASLLERLKLGAPSSDIRGKEILATDDRDKRGITAFELGGVSTITMFHIEPDKDDSWLMRFDLTGHMLNQEWEQGGYRTYEMHAPQVGDNEIDFWRQRMSK